MILKRKLYDRIKTITSYGIGQILSVFSVLVLSLFIVKFHSVKLWGIYAEILIWTNLFLLFLSFGSYDSLLKSFSETPSSINQLWVNNLMTRSILLVPSIVLLFFIPIFKSFLLWVILLIFLQFSLQSFKVLIVYHRKFNLTILVEIIYTIFLIGILFFQYSDLDIKQLLQLICFAYLLKLIIYSIFLLKRFNNITYSLELNELKKSVPFFIPVAVGTIRTKIDTYYGSHFFNSITLSKYQVFISFLMLAQMASSFIITPYIKTLYRSKNVLIQSIQKQFFVYGCMFSVVFTAFLYIFIEYIYGFEFTLFQYFLALIFVAPLVIHILLVNEYYKKNLQSKIAKFASLIVIVQIIIGYFLIKHNGINGALLLKALGQWAIVIILWLWIKKERING